MSIQENIKLDEAMVAAFNAHDIDTYLTYVSDAIVTTNLAIPEPQHGTEAVRQFLSSAFAAFSDYAIVVQNRTVTDDTIVTEIIFSGTHDGPLHLGVEQTLSPTGHQINVQGIYVNTVRGGMVVESRQYPNLVGMMTQLGLMGVPGNA
jgi:hypothetical protein